MRILLVSLFTMIIPFAILPVAWAQDDQEVILLDETMLTVCPASTVQSPPANFDAPDCKHVPQWNLDPHHKTVWVTGSFSTAAQFITDNRPIGLYLSVKSASRVYVNGREIGANGTPGLQRLTEKPGSMDAVFFVPDEIIRTGKNEVTILLSGHHSILDLKHPLHGLLLTTYQPARYHMLLHYWPTLLAFGVFVIGALYFVAMAGLGQAVYSSLILSIGSAFAAIQLLAEASRALWSYPYYFHDIRLICIVGCSFIVGTSILTYVGMRFLESKRATAVSAISALSIIGLFFIQSYDAKAVWVHFIPSIGAALISLHAALQRKQSARWFTVVLFGFAALIAVAPTQFLDSNGYFALAAVFVFLFTQQARLMRDMRHEALDIMARSKQLEQALEKASSSRPFFINVRSSGKIEKLPAHEISTCSGAGDYVEITLISDRKILHNGSLTGLEEQLPNTFLRVHRSHIVNTEQIQQLNRQPSGSGELVLATSQIVPVSRRIMPQVRTVIEAA